MKNPKIFSLLGLDKESISQRYHNQTKIESLPKNPPSSDTWPPEWKTVNFKGYPRFTKIYLPKPTKLNATSLEKTLLNRKSRREMDVSPMKLQDFSKILFFSAGLKPKSKSDIGARTYPSAGSRYPLEIYLLILNVKGIEKGLYHYHLKSHSLEQLTIDESEIKDIQNSFNQNWLLDSSVIFLVSSVFWRNKIKYGDRGYRFSLLDAGHLCQNIYLTAEALKLACCEVGGFEDDNLHNILNIDGLNEALIVVISIGKIKSKRG